MEMALWVADGALGLFRDQQPLLSQPCFALCREKYTCFAAGAKQGHGLHMKTGRVLFSFALPGGVCVLEMFGPHLCALSTEADALFAFHPQTGSLCLSAPAGNYPRHFEVSPCRSFAAVAGGAAGDVLIFDHQLQCLRTFRVPGAVVSLCFLPRGLAALCAVGDEQVSSRLYFISPRGVMEEVFACPTPPVSLCALPGGRLLMGCHGGIWHLHDGRAVGRRPCVYPARIRPAQKGYLYADAWQGCIRTEKGEMRYQGQEPVDFMQV